MIYPIVAYGTPVLKKVAQDIEKGEDLSQLIEDMFETMEQANGIGLAAPQINKSIRLFKNHLFINLLFVFMNVRLRNRPIHGKPTRFGLYEVS